MTQIEQTKDGKFSYTYCIQRKDGTFEDITEIGPIEEIIKLKRRLEGPLRGI
jgi:hypothetical protein